jgi:hypothetical protein
MIVKKIINKINFHKYPIIVFIILSFIPFLWFRGEPISFGDPGFFFIFYHPNYIIKKAFYLILPTNLGTFPYLLYFYPIILTFSAIFFISGHNYLISQEIMFVLIMFFSMLYFYLFCMELNIFERNKKFSSTMAAIFYLFNLFVLIYYITIFQFSFYLLPFTSIFLFILIRWLKTKKFIYIVIMSLIISLFSIGEFEFPTYVVIILLFLFIFMYKTFETTNLKNIKENIIYSGLILLIIFLINMWFILPFLYNSFSEYYNVAKFFPNFKEVYSGNSYFTNILEYFSNCSTFINSGFLSLMHFRWVNNYHNKIFIILGFLITLIILIPILTNFKKSAMIIGIFLLGIYFSIGAKPPFSGIKIWLFQHLPFTMLFNENYAFNSFFIVSASILFGYGIGIIYNTIIKKMKYLYANIIISIVLLIFFGLYVFPLWSNNIFNGYQFYNRKKILFSIKIPDYYNKAKKYFKQKKVNYNILTLPLVSSESHYNWHFGFEGNGPTFLLYEHSSISNLMHDTFFQDILINKFQNNGYKKFINTASLFSVKYIVLQNDILEYRNYYTLLNNHFNLKHISKAELRIILNTSKGLKLARKFGKLDIYKISDKYFLFKVWTPKRVIFVKHELKLHDLDNYMVPITMQNSFKVRTAVFAKLFSQNRHSERIKNHELNNIADKYSKQYSLNNKTLYIPASNKTLTISETVKKINTPTVEFKEINPSKYAVIVHNAKASFPLIFNLMYLAGWNVYPQIYPKRTEVNRSDNNYNHNDDAGDISKQTNTDTYKNITFTGNKFISKDINGTVQNNNIPNGHILQTLFEKPMPTKYHFVADGYSNSWWINLNYIKKLGPRYYKVNKNGTVDFELIIDYWPQRLLYIGLIISGSSLFIIIAYLIFDATRKRKNKKDANIDNIDNTKG